MHNGHKPYLMEVTDPDRGLLACMRGDYGFGWYALSWIGALTLGMLHVVMLATLIAGG
jgi:hypothetical protein